MPLAYQTHWVRKLRILFQVLSHVLGSGKFPLGTASNDEDDHEAEQIFYFIDLVSTKYSRSTTFYEWKNSTDYLNNENKLSSAKSSHQEATEHENKWANIQWTQVTQRCNQSHGTLFVGWMCVKRYRPGKGYMTKRTSNHSGTAPGAIRNIPEELLDASMVKDVDLTEVAKDFARRRLHKFGICTSSVENPW